VTNQQKVQTLGSPKNVTAGNQTVVIPSGGTQYIIVNQGAAVQNINSPIVNQPASTVFSTPKTVPGVIAGVRLAGQVTRPLKIVHTVPSASEVRTLLTTPRLPASQSPNKAPISHTLSSLSSIVDNASFTTTIPTQTTVTSNMNSVGRGVMRKRGGGVKQPVGRGKRPIKHNYFVDTVSYQKGTVTPGVENCVVQTVNTDVIKPVPLPSHVVIAGPQNSVRLLQTAINAPTGGKTIRQRVRYSVPNPTEHGYSSPSQANSSLVDYSDSDSQSNSSEKCDSETASDPPKSQHCEGQTLSNGRIMMPTSLSDALARAKPNEKIPVDLTNPNVKFQTNVVYSIVVKGQPKNYRFDGQYLVPGKYQKFRNLSH
jgi:hypothetical protein